MIKYLIFLILFIPALAFGANQTYFVTPTGSASDPDCSGGGAPTCSGAWDMSDFNNAANWSATDSTTKIDPGDTVYFTGNFTTQVHVRGNGTAGNHIILDGLYSGDYNALNEGSDGQAKITLSQATGDSNIGFYLREGTSANDGHDYIIIQDFEINEFLVGILLAEDADHIVMKRIYMHDGLTRGINPTYSENYGNGVHNITIGGARGDGVTIKDVGVGTGSADILIGRSNDFIISYNHLYATKSTGASTDRGIDGIAFNNQANTAAIQNVLVEYNSIHDHDDNYYADAYGCGSGCIGRGENELDIKDDKTTNPYGTSKTIIRYNNMYGSTGGLAEYEVLFNTCQGIYLYGNYIHDGNGAIYEQNRDPPLYGYIDIYVYSNIFEHSTTGSAVALNATMSASTSYYFNNTFIENSTAPANSGHCSLVNQGAGDYIFKNNIYYKSRPESSDHRQIWIADGDGESLTSDYNIYYWPSETSALKWDILGDIPLSSVQGGSSEGLPQETHSTEENPDLNSDYTIAGPSSGAYRAGTDMGSGNIASITIEDGYGNSNTYYAPWDIALAPGTNFGSGKTLPVVYTLNRDVIGWDAGAYGFGGTVQIYYVTQTGAGSNSGQTGAWVTPPTSSGQAMSVAQFNNVVNWSSSESSNDIDPGDTVYFSGTITSEITPKGSGSTGLPIILDGYSAGDFDPWGGGTSNAIFTGGLWINNAYSYITVQDFRASTGSRPSYPMVSVYNNTSSGHSSNIIFQRNYFYNANYSLLGILRTYYSSSYYEGPDYITIEENRMVGYGKTTSEQGLNFTRVSNLVIRNNELANSLPSYSSSGDNVIEIHGSHNYLLEYNYIHSANDQSGISNKELGSAVNYDGIIRFNKFYYNGRTDSNYDGRGISFSSDAGYSNHDIYVYGNYIYQNENHGLDFHRGNYNMWAWSNVITGNTNNGIIMWTASGYLPEHDIHIYNNTIVHNETEYTGSSEVDRTGFGLRETAATNIYFKNNILYYNRPNVSANYQQWASNSTMNSGVSDYNTLYYPSQTATYYYFGAVRTLATMQGYGLEMHSNIQDPGFNDGSLNYDDTDDYSLDGTYVNDGVDLSGTIATVSVQGINYTMDAKWALNPGLNWTQDAPDIEAEFTSNPMLDRDEVGWSRGAYAYSIGVYNVSPANNETGVPTTKVATWDYGANVDDVDLWLTKDTCANIRSSPGECNGTPDSDDDADKQYDMSTLDIDSDYCLELKANSGASQGSCQQFDFTTTTGPSAVVGTPTGLKIE